MLNYGCLNKRNLVFFVMCFDIFWSKTKERVTAQHKQWLSSCCRWNWVCVACGYISDILNLNVLMYQQVFNLIYLTVNTL